MGFLQFIWGFVPFWGMLIFAPRRLFVGYATLATGAHASITLGLLIIVFFSLFGIIGLVIGIVTATFTARALWNKGLANVPPKHRAIPLWMGNRQEDGRLELVEGDCWLLPWFVKKIDYSMEETTLFIKDMAVEVQDETIVHTDVSLQTRPVAGKLYYFGLLKNATTSFEAETRAIARAFGVTRKNLDSLVDGTFPDKMKAAVLKHLKYRSEGKINRVTFNEAGDATFEKAEEDVTPWGVDFISVNLPNFTPPAEVTDAATEIAQAEKRLKASEKEQAAMTPIMDGLIARGVNATAAMSMAASMVLPPEKQPKVETVNHLFSGIDNSVRTFVNGVLVGLGKEPLPEPELKPTTPPQPGAETAGASQ